MCDFYFAGFISKLFKGYLREACFPPSSYARCLLFLKASSPVKLLHWTLLHQPPSNPLSHIYSRCSPISLAFVRALHSHKSATARWIIYHPSLVLLLSSRCHYNYYAFYTRGSRRNEKKKQKGRRGPLVYTCTLPAILSGKTAQGYQRPHQDISSASRYGIFLH